MKLGRKFPTKAKLKLSKYLGPALPPAPPSCDWTTAMSQDWGVMRNDTLGDCTCAAMGHAVQVVTANGDGLITPTDDDVVKMYELVGHYDPSDPNSDQGATEVDAMKFMVDHGLAGVRCDAFADVDETNIEQVKQCIALFGGVYIGVMITQADMNAFKAGAAWGDTGLGNVLGGHALWVPAYQPDSGVALTWGQAQVFSWDWFAAKCDEAHAVLMFPWVKNSINCSPDGFDCETLEADLKSL